MKKRYESSFGLHFDFHSGPNNNVGATLREEDIRAICRTVKPDFLQIDCKGHPGWASYPTKLGNSTRGIVFDTLEMWRRKYENDRLTPFYGSDGSEPTIPCCSQPDYKPTDEQMKKYLELIK